LPHAAVVLGIALVVGVPLGWPAGYWNRSRISTLILRVVGVLLAGPRLPLALVVTVAFEPSLITTVIAISFTW